MGELIMDGSAGSSRPAPAPAATHADRALQESGLPANRLEQLVEVARAAALAGARPLKEMFGQLERVKEKGDAGNLVTEADLAAEAAVLAVLQEATPTFGVLAEESGRRQGDGPLEWCVDPLDEIGRAHV